MKKLFVTGMVILSTSFASAVVAKSPREMLVDYTKTVREAIFGGAGKTAGSLNKAALEKVKKGLVDELGIPELHTVMSGSSATAHMDHLVTVVAAKKMAVELQKNSNTAEEGKSIESAAKATAKLIANSNLVGAFESRELAPAEATLVKEALGRLEKLPTDILTKFSKAERDSYTQVLEKYDQLNHSGNGKTAEENLVNAIMQAKNVDKAKALEIVKKLKECV